MRVCEVIVRLPAENDLDDIWFSIAQSNVSLANRFVENLKRRFLLLASFPESGPLRPDIFPNIRILVEGSYIVLYVFKYNTIEILRVIHGSRDFSELDIT